MKTQDMDIDAAIQQGAYVSLDAAGTLSTFMVNGWPDTDRFLEGFRNLIQSASKAENSRVAICGEGVALLCPEGKTEVAIRREQLGNILAETHNVDTLRAYPFSLLIQEDDLPRGTHHDPYYIPSRPTHSSPTRPVS